MSAENERIDFADLISKLSPEERLRLEDLAVVAVLRDARARVEAVNPEGFRIVREHAEEVARAIGPIPRDAEEAVREALAEIARGILRRED